MSKILDKFKEKKKLIFIPFFVAGYPSFFFLEDFLLKYKDKIDILELGIPFSDPIADGPILEEVNYQAIKKGVNFENTINWLKEKKIPSQITTILLLYFNLIYQNLEKNLQRIKEVGIEGLVIPDLPFEEAESFLELFKSYNLDLIFFLSPTTNKDRKEKILKLAESFIYCISVKGVTGEREELSSDGIRFIKEIREKSNKPLVWGFGLSRREHIRALKGLVDGVIVGSAFAKRILEGKDFESYFLDLFEETL
ncbi:MAG: tryptophan synthase subunit alpha [Dictyoglomaceae bacterium]|nr:tryptophan synthase subunit alpha [Dictyoglomaceae bacterium]